MHTLVESDEFYRGIAYIPTLLVHTCMHVLEHKYAYTTTRVVVYQTDEFYRGIAYIPTLLVHTYMHVLEHKYAYTTRLE